MTWNVDGLKNKLADSEFVRYINSFDIVGLVETWVCDVSEVSGYFTEHASYCCAAKSSKRGGRNMGGVIVLIKHRFVKYTKQVVSNFEFGVLLDIDKALLNIDCNVLYACIYFPPAGSPFYSHDSATGLEYLENEILKVHEVHQTELIITGDFNARTADFDDFVVSDNHVPLFREYNNVFREVVTTRRVSSDKTINKWGRELLNFCKAYGVSIVNGRLDDGDYTFIDTIGCSVIDYFIATKPVYDFIVDLSVGSRSESKHLPVACYLECVMNTVPNNSDQPQAEVYYKFSSDDERMEFKETISNNITDGHFDAFDSKLRNYEADINEVIQELEQLILECSDSSKKVRASKPQKGGSSSQRWFDDECRMHKTAKNQALRAFRSSKNVYDLNNYLELKKVFNRVCKAKKTIFDRNTLASISSSVNNQRQFWHNVKLSQGRTRVLPQVPIADWYNHFKNVFQSNNVDEEATEAGNVEGQNVGEIENDLFNREITEDEIRQAIHDLNNNKASAGLLIPEHFKLSQEMLLPYVRILFNRLYESHVFPEEWALSVIIPIHKKGPTSNPDNYRGISLLQILSKIYISIVTKRLTFYVNAFNRITEAQSGFRSGYSTIDNGFILYAVVSKYMCRKGKKVYVAFVDFKKAFDSVHRSKLFEILVEKGISGNLLNTIKAIYNSVKGHVRHGVELSDVFECPVGLRQGCSLSPILFTLFINKLYEIIENSGISGIQLTPEITQIFALLFADDVALVADTVIGLQRQLNILSSYSDEWKIKVNVQKTKILVFKNGGQLSRHEKWYYKGDVVETVSGFTYVGHYFTSRLSMYRMSESTACKAKRVLISLLSSLNHLMPMSRSVFYKLFDVKIAPILLYGAELWGLSDMHDVERVHVYACKRFMSAPVRACTAAVLGDCERYPMYVNAAKRCIQYWLRIMNMPDHRYVKQCYVMLKYYDSIGCVNWVTKVKHSLCSNGFGYIWEQQNAVNQKLFICQFVQRLKDQYMQQWVDVCNSTSKLDSYCLYKTSFTYEKYLDVLDVKKFRYSFASFRTSSHKLMIEKGRHLGIHRDRRYCFNCLEAIESEYHFLLVCPLYVQLRETYIPKKFYEVPTVNKFNILMASTNEAMIKRVATYIFYGMKLRTDLMAS